MRTTKPIATISFNSPGFLELKLKELTRAKRVSFWAFIVHKPEDDEGGKKTHIHLYIEPSKMLQTDDLKEEFQEFDPENPSKPKGCITFNSSKFDPWYLYALHDKRYLASKGQSRHFHYVHDDILSSDPDDLLFKMRSIDLLSLSPYFDMEDAISKGETFNEFFKRGYVPITLVKQYEHAWYLLTSQITERNGRSNHPLDVDSHTGEVISSVPQISPQTLSEVEFDDFDEFEGVSAAEVRSAPSGAETAHTVKGEVDELLLKEFCELTGMSIQEAKEVLTS